MSRAALLAAVVLTAINTAAAADPLPKIPKQQDYGQARKALISQGWLPVTIADADTCQAGDKRCEGRPEMFACAGSGMASCVFTWKRGKALIEVTTAGEERAVVSRVTCKSGCR